VYPAYTLSTSATTKLTHHDPPSYDSFVPELTSVRFKARRLIHKYTSEFPDDPNATFETIAADRMAILKELLGHVGEDAIIEPPFRVDYGCNISIGER
jgi:acetyltransferase-like isoleucine patch superfamily enzyme